MRRIQGGPKGVSYCTLSISSLTIDQFSKLFTCKLCKKFATHWHAHHTYYLATLYLAKHKYPKTNNSL